MFKNVASQKVAVYAHDTAADAPKTGDAANITAYISKDGGAAAQTNDANPTELDATNMKGIYVFDLTQAETNCDLFLLSAVSATADIFIQPVEIYTTALTGTEVAELTLMRKLLQNRKEFDLDNSKVYLWNDAGDAREYEADLTDNAGDAVTTTTQGPINCTRWTAV